jgi:hypothetical protein
MQTTSPTAETVKDKLFKIAWQVSTNVKATTPFDLCVSNIRAIRKLR